MHPTSAYDTNPFGVVTKFFVAKEFRPTENLVIGGMYNLNYDTGGYDRVSFGSIDLDSCKIGFDFLYYGEADISQLDIGLIALNRKGNC